MGSVDLGLFRSINQWPESLSPFLRFFSIGNTLLGVKIALLVMVIGMIARGGKARFAAIAALIAVPLTDGLCNVLKKTFPVHRPFQDHLDVIMRVGKTASMGTASSHAGNMAAVATVFTLVLGWRWGLPWIFVALFTGISRIYVGAHYPLQVLLGWTVGILLGTAAASIANRMLRRRAELNPSSSDGQASSCSTESSA